MAVYKRPGVYIEEQPATGPISPLGTSTAAFIGPAMDGPINTPTKITNWSQFKDNFGEYISAPRHYLAHAVQGFFLNGGSVAYIVRVGTASKANRTLADRGAGNSLFVEALDEGPTGNNINIQITDAQIVTTAIATKPEATVANGSNALISVTSASDAENFRAGDIITIQGSAERVTIDRISGTEIFLVNALTGVFAAGTLRIADLAPGQTQFRVENGDGLELGSVIALTQGGTTEDIIVDGYQGDLVTVRGGLANSYGMASADADVAITSYEYNLLVTAPGHPDENFLNLSMDSRHSRHFSRIVSSNQISVRLPDVPSLALPPDNRPALVNGTLSSGSADDLTSIAANHYQIGIDSLRLIDDVNLLCIPDRTDATVQQAMITHCENMADRFAILDPAEGRAPFGDGSITTDRAALESARGYAALYYPRINISDPNGADGAIMNIPPSGHLAGVYAKTDTQRGVHKAPANDMIAGSLGLERSILEDEMGELNIAGINVIRTFPNRARPTIWGARTTAPAAEAPWRYINVRRLLLMIEESIQEGTRWAVFEPNDIALWQKLTRNISTFLYQVWKDGGLFGASQEEAFYVKCDEETNPSHLRSLGQVVVEIGVAPVRPAEFVVIKIGQWEGGESVVES